LKSENTTQKIQNEKLKSDLESLGTGFETFRKLTNTRLKSLQGLDFTEHEARCTRFEQDISLQHIAEVCYPFLCLYSIIKNTVARLG
jgi:hypothetical protein